MIGSAITIYKRQNEKRNLNKIEYMIVKSRSLENSTENRYNRKEEYKNMNQVNINQATIKDLEALPSIGPVLAQRIIDERNRVGKFSSLEDLLKVKGIGPKILERIKDKIRIEN